MKRLGIDIGGTGIKGAIVDTETGQVLSERIRYETPQPATPEAVGKTIKQICTDFEWDAPFGCTFPAVISHGVVKTATNISQKWINTNAQKLFQEITNNPVIIVNDADAAGIAELHFGKAADHDGTVIVLTFGTGIGSAIILNGELLPNCELGHLFLRNQKQIVERYASNSAREINDLSWKKWTRRVNKYLAHLELLFSPDLFIIGGGIANRSEKIESRLHTKAPWVFASLKNFAGIVGAAYLSRNL